MSQAALEPDGSSSSTRNSCMFYKLIVGSTLRDRKLKIPRKFVKKYGNELSSMAILYVPDGRIWVVELQRANKTLWLDNGWHEFVKHYSIRDGNLLVFSYEGKSKFNVWIFDAKEINYPGTSSGRFSELRHYNHCSAPQEKEVMGCDIIEISDSDSQCSVPYNWTSQDTGLQLHKNEFRGTSNEVELIFSSGAAEGRTGRAKQMTGPYVDMIKPAKVVNSRALTGRHTAVMEEEKHTEILAANMFKSDNPFCKVILRRSYVYGKYGLYLPSSFSRRYMNCIPGSTIMLQVSDGKKWPVQFVSRNSEALLKKGWPNFVLANNLKERDVCIFEKINAEDVVLKVSIFRVPEDTEPENQPPKKNLQKSI